MGIQDKMIKAILLGCSHSELGLLATLKNNNVFVIGVGNLKTAAGKKLCDEFHQFDYRDHAQLCALAHKVQASFIISSCNDYGIFAASKASSKLGLPGYDQKNVIETVHFKNKYKEFLVKLKIPTPALIFSGEYSKLRDNWLSLRNDLLVDKKYLFKPIDQGSGNGISEINRNSNLEDILRLLHKFSNSEMCLIEEYVEGSLHSYSAFIKDGEIDEEFMVDEWLRESSRLVDRSCYPSLLPDRIKEELSEVTRTIMSELNLVDGLVHHQFIFDGCNFFILETTRRNPGDLFGEQIKLLEGKDFCSLLLNRQFNLKLDCECYGVKSATRVCRKVFWTDEVITESNMSGADILSFWDLSNQYEATVYPTRCAIVFSLKKSDEDDRFDIQNLYEN